MDITEVRRMCDRLRELVGAVPGKNDAALKEAVHLIDLLQDTGHWNGPQDKLTTIKGWLAVWFSQRRWKKFGDAGEICRQSLLDDVLVVENHWRS